MYETLIRGGWVVNGTGSQRCRADIAIRNGRIAAIGPDLGGQAERIIDACGFLQRERIQGSLLADTGFDGLHDADGESACPQGSDRGAADFGLPHIGIGPGYENASLCGHP